MLENAKYLGWDCRRGGMANNFNSKPNQKSSKILKTKRPNDRKDEYQKAENQKKKHLLTSQIKDMCGIRLMLKPYGTMVSLMIRVVLFKFRYFIPFSVSESECMLSLLLRWPIWQIFKSLSSSNSLCDIGWRQLNLLEL